jgi:hypothetical protein
VYDTICIDIQPGFSFDIGNDTVIFMNDTILFSLPDIYDSITWFDDTHSTSTFIYGNAHSPGILPIWAEVYIGPCFSRDTLLLDIIDDSGLTSWDDPGIKVFPNPFNGELIVEYHGNINKTSIIDIDGHVLFSKEFDGEKGNLRIGTEGLKSGIYLLKIETGDGRIITRKVVKL